MLIKRRDYEMDKLPILIVNFKTPEMVYYNILSIKKSTPNAKIYVFDNSDDGTIFVSPFDDVTVIDNTGNQIFDKWSGGGYEEGFGGSAMHAKTIQTCFDLIDGDGFVLLDSDIIVKKDLNELYDPNYIFTGAIEGRRIAPYCCYINTKMCKDMGIKYFVDGSVTKEDDCGTYFLKILNDNGLKIKLVDIWSYVSHFTCGSYRQGMVEAGRFSNEETYEKFLMDNKEYIPLCGGLVSKEEKCPILIVNFNTKKHEIEKQGLEKQLIYYAVSSVRKHMPNRKIYIFENSRETDKFDISGFDNVTVIDNTRAFYFDRLSCIGGEMHARSVQAAMNIFSNIGIDGFILLDSDVVVKRDLKKLCKQEYICVGEKELYRISPYCCFINVKMSKEHKIKFYRPGSFGVINCEWHDCGANFADEFKKKNLQPEFVSLNEFVAHYGAGSYKNFWGKNDKEVTDFVMENKQYWE